MNQLNLRHYLIDWLNANGLEALAEHDIRVARDARYPDLFNLKYGSVMADKTLPIVRACRGAVVEKVGDKFELKAYAFDRFFNEGEGGCHQLNWDNVRVYEKYDGSLIKLFHYKGEWLVSTSGSVAGASNVGTTDRSFAQLFWDVFAEVGGSRVVLLPELCYVFELCHKDNRIVVNYEQAQLPLLAVRDSSQDFEELDLEEFRLCDGFNIAQSYDFGDIAAVQSAAEGRGADHEGFILFDGVGRVKVKSGVYCQLHRVKGNNEPDFSELFLNDDLDEFLLHFPEYKAKFDCHLEYLAAANTLVNNLVTGLAHYSQKEFARGVLDCAGALSGACFSVRAGKHRDLYEFVSQQTPKQLDRLLGIA